MCLNRIGFTTRYLPRSWNTTSKLRMNYKGKFCSGCNEFVCFYAFSRPSKVYTTTKAYLFKTWIKYIMKILETASYNLPFHLWILFVLLALHCHPLYSKLWKPWHLVQLGHCSTKFIGQNILRAIKESILPGLGSFCKSKLAQNLQNLLWQRTREHTDATKDAKKAQAWQESHHPSPTMSEARYGSQR